MSDTVLALDVYGTLIDPHAIVRRLREGVGEAATQFSNVWRTKQLEFSFRRALMGRYEDFRVVTRDALDYADAALNTSLSESEKSQLMLDYTHLDPFDEVPEALRSLRGAGRQLFAFSNGHPLDLEHLLERAGIADLLDGIVSVHDVRSFKPDAKVYAHFAGVTGAPAEAIRLVSSNGFDVSGAMASGWSASWLKRSADGVFDGWDGAEAELLQSLSDLSVD